MAAVIAQMFSEVPLVDRATADDETPTPGYMYNEIIQLTTSSNDLCNKVLSQLLTRLTLRRPRIKLKVLHVMRHCIEKGSPAFRRALQRKSENLRSCLTFRGAPDPLRGDAPYQQVREQAQLIINMLFDTPTEQSVGEKRISTTGFGSNDVRGGQGPSVSKPMIGMGSSNFPNSPARSPSSPAPATSRSGEYVFVQTPTSMGHFIPQKEDSGSNILEVIKSKITGETVPTTPAEMRNRRMGQEGFGTTFVDYNKHMIKNANFEYSGEREVGTPMGGWGPAAQTQPTSDGSLESRLVDEITNPSGVRSVPTRQEMAQFVSRCAAGQVDTELIFQYVTEKLAAPKWQARLKALTVIEALIKGQVGDAVGFFSQEEIARARLSEQLSSVQKSVKDKAIQIVQSVAPDLLQGQGLPAESPSDLPPARSTDSPNIFDVDGQEDDASPEGSLFAGLSESDGHAAEPTTELFASLTLSDAKPAAPAPVASVAAPAPRVARPVAPQTRPAAVTGDLLQEAPASPTSAAAANNNLLFSLDFPSSTQPSSFRVETTTYHQQHVVPVAPANTATSPGQVVAFQQIAALQQQLLYLQQQITLQPNIAPLLQQQMLQLQQQIALLQSASQNPVDQFPQLARQAPKPAQPSLLQFDTQNSHEEAFNFVKQELRRGK